MFTGIIEEAGAVEWLVPLGGGHKLRIACRTVVEDAVEGSSIAVNGVCLTALDVTPAGFSAVLAPETAQRTNLGNLRAGSIVNLERPLEAGGRLSGHIVQGHVDGTGVLRSVQDLGEGNYWLEIAPPPEILRYLVFKGSVAVDGISLTIARLERESFAVTIIPHTWENTNLRARRTGEALNIECDILAKYVERLTGRGF